MPRPFFVIFGLLLTLILPGCLDRGDSADKASKAGGAPEMPTDAKQCNALGEARFAKGDGAGAIKCYDEAIRLDHKLAIAYSNRGWAWACQGDYYQAL